MAPTHAATISKEGAPPHTSPPRTPSLSDDKKDLAFVEAQEIDPTGNVLDNERIRDHFAPVDAFEGKHRYDPNATWTEEEELKLVRKIDWRIMSFCCLLFFAMQLDRNNIGSALADNFLGDLKMTTLDYNNGQSIFFCCFLAAELPSQLANKWLGTQNWVPFQVIAWSTLTIGQGFITNRGQFFAIRALLGFAEGGLIPDMVLYLTYWYKNSELPSRLAWFWTCLAMTGVVQGFLAFGVLRLRALGVYPGWSYLFWIEGALTFSIGVFAIFYLPSSPTETKGRARGKKGWFTEREEVILINRVLREDSSKGQMAQSQHISWREFKQCLADYDNFPLYLYALTAILPFGPPGAYLSLTLRGLGFSAINIQLLSIPAPVIGVVLMLLVTHLSQRLDSRAYVLLIAQFWAIIFLTALVCLPSSSSKWAFYAVLTLLLANPSPHSLAVAWNATNSGSVRLRTVSASLYNIVVQGGNTLSTQVYRPSDLPRYSKANRILIGVACLNVLYLLAMKVYYTRRNAWKLRTWKEMTVDEQEAYVRDVAPTAGNRSLLFQLKH